MPAFHQFNISSVNAASVQTTSWLIVILVLFVLPVTRTLLTTTADAQSATITGTGAVSDELGKAETVVIDRGTVTFAVTTNVPGVTVKGKSEALHARVQIRRESQGVTVDHVEAWLPVKTLATGIALRDQHMRQDIFTSTGAEVPDLRFEGGNASCSGVTAGREALCTVSGSLSIRGVARDFSMTLKVHEAGSAPLLRAGGDGLVKLSDYGIEAPSQFGVRTANEVHVHIEFPETAPTADAGGVR